MLTTGISPTDTHTAPQFTLGTVATQASDTGTKSYIYVRAGAAITGAGYVCDIDSSTFAAVMSTTTTTAPGTGAGKSVGVARVAFASADYGWLQVYGSGTVRTAALAAAYTNLNSTATAGQVDDDATAGSEVIEGIVLDVATGASAGVTAGWINWPRVGRTL